MSLTTGPNKIARAQSALYYYIRAMKEKNHKVGKTYERVYR